MRARHAHPDYHAIAARLPSGRRGLDLGIEGNTNANGTRRVKQVISPTAFTISYMNGRDAAGNGAFRVSELGSWAGATVGYPLKPHPRLWLDGPAGELTARLKDPDGSGPAKAPRPQRESALGSSLFVGRYDRLGVRLEREKLPRVPGRHLRDDFRHGAEMVLRPVEVHGSRRREALDPQCRPHGRNAGLRRGQLGLRRRDRHGLRSRVLHPAGGLTYTLIHDQLDPAEIARFTGMMLNDRTDGGACTSMYQPGDGSVVEAVPGSPAGVLTGSGTSWSRSMRPATRSSFPPCGSRGWCRGGFRYAARIPDH